MSHTLRRIAPVTVLATLVLLATACLPGIGNPSGGATVPPDGQAVDTSHPTHVIGTGTPASCTSAAVVTTVALGGIITFNCGPDPVTITLTKTAKIVNDTGPEIVIDGGGKVTLSGGGARRILYMDTCDQAQVLDDVALPGPGHAAAHRAEPDLRRRQLDRARPSTAAAAARSSCAAGGSRSSTRRSSATSASRPGPDIGGAAIRVLSQSTEPARVRREQHVRRGIGPGQLVLERRRAVSSIGVSWAVLNSVLQLQHRRSATAPTRPESGTPGGGSGGAIYIDGNTYTLHVAGSPIIANNHANEGGGAIFFVSNDRTGTLRIDDSTLLRNPSDGFQTAGFPGIFYLGSGPPVVTNSTIG